MSRMRIEGDTEVTALLARIFSGVDMGALLPIPNERVGNPLLPDSIAHVTGYGYSAGLNGNEKLVVRQARGICPVP